MGGNPISKADPRGLDNPGMGPYNAPSPSLRGPDYGTVSVPIVGPVGVSLTIDRTGNVYVGLGLGVGLRGGAGLGVGWTGDKCTPSSEQLENFLGEWGANVGVGLGATWSSPQAPGNERPERLGLNIQTPGVSVGYNWKLGNLK